MWLSFIGKVQKERFLISWRELFAWTLSGSSAYHLWSSKGSWWSSQCANYKETTCGSSFITTEIWEASTGPKGQKKDSFKAEATGQLTFVSKSNALRKAAKEDSSITRSWRQIKWKVRSSKGLLKRYAKIFFRTFSTAGSVLICTVRIYYFAYVI